MLILSRVPGEKIVLTHEPSGETITVLLTKTVGSRAYIGFKAGKNFTILRKEVLGEDFEERMFEPHCSQAKKENHASSQESPLGPFLRSLKS